MASELQTWLSVRDNKIVDCIDGVCNEKQANNHTISVNYDYDAIQSVNVCLSEKSAIETFTDKSSVVETKVKQNVCEWFANLNERKQVLRNFSTLCQQSSQVIQLLETLTSNATLTVSQIRVQYLSKALNYAQTNSIFNYGFKQFQKIRKHCIKFNDSQSVLLKFIQLVIPTLLCGANITLIAVPTNALAIAYLVDMLVRSGIKPGIINMIIVDTNSIEQLDQTIKQKNPIIVIFESGDVYSAVERIAIYYQTNTLLSLNAFVQQSVYKKFIERMKSQLPNLFQIGNKYENTSDLEVEVNVNYEAIDIDCHDNFSGISIYQFRSNEEAKQLVNHFIDIQYISLWAEKTSLALEFAQLITSSDQIYINCGLSYDSILEIPIYSTVMDSIDINSIANKELFESILKSQTKWNSYDECKRNAILNDYIVNINSTLNTSTITFNKSIREVYENNGMKLTFSYRKPIGLLALQIGEESENLGQSIILSNVLKTLQMGNALIVFGTNQFTQLKVLWDHLVSIENGGLKNLMHFAGNRNDTSNSIIKSEGKAVGIYYKLTDASGISNDIITIFNKSITLQIGDMCFAK